MRLTMDANVLIDYASTDPSILTLCANHLGPVYIPSVILDEVDQLDEADCESLGLSVVEEPVDILTAAAGKHGPLSFEDRVCLMLARENQWTCVTNEKPLHRACKQEGVAHIWGLRLMIELVRAEQLTGDGEKFDDAKIVDEVMNNWDDSKKRIARQRWLDALSWMHSKGLVPHGFGAPTQ